MKSISPFAINDPPPLEELISGDKAAPKNELKAFDCPSDKVPFVRNLTSWDLCLHTDCANLKVPMLFLFAKSWGVVGTAIRLFTRSQYTHAAFIHPASIFTYPLYGHVLTIEAYPSAYRACEDRWWRTTSLTSVGVLYKLVKSFDTSWKFAVLEDHKGTENEIVVVYVPLDTALKAIAFMEYLASSRHPYNFLGIVGFLIPLFVSNGGYFCSEGIWEAFRFANERYESVPGWKLAPDQLRSQLETLFNENFQVLYSGDLRDTDEVRELSHRIGQLYLWYRELAQILLPKDSPENTLTKLRTFLKKLNKEKEN